MSVFNGYFFHDMTRKYTLVFGSLFNDIEVKRWKSDTIVKDVIEIPVIQAEKDKFLQRIKGDVGPDGTGGKNVAVQIPAISFELVDIAYDGSRKLQKSNYIRYNRTDSMASKMFTPAPYTLSFEVNIAAPTLSEMHQIIEQIIPAFQPDVNVSVRCIDGIVLDTPVYFTGITKSDEYDGLIEDKRNLIWSLGFTLKGYYFAPVRDRKIILDVTADVIQMHDDGHEEPLATFHADKDDMIGSWRYANE